MRALMLAPVILFAVAAAPAGLPPLKMFESAAFQPGLWTLEPLDDDSRMRNPKGVSSCVVEPAMLFHTGFNGAEGAKCSHVVLENEARQATVTYTCPGRGAGRTSVRRAGDHYVVEASGFSNREPFELRGRYVRVAACAG